MYVTDIFEISYENSVFEKEITNNNGTWEYSGTDIRLTEKTVKKGQVYVKTAYITNLTDKPISVHEAGVKFNYNGGSYQVYTQRSVWCKESVGAWQTLNAGVSGQASEVRLDVGDVPYFALYNLQNRRGTAFHIMPNSLWFYRVSNRFRQMRKGATVEVVIGIKDFILQPEETVAMPEVIFYDFTDTRDMDAYKLHRYCNEYYPKRKLPVIYNSWMSRFDNISYELLSQQLEIAADIGCEYFVIDAGWFGPTNAWYGIVGDWKEETAGSMAGRMKEFSALVNSKGLKFGLWFEIERAALTSAAVKAHPDYYITEDGAAFVDFSNSQAVDYIYGVLKENIQKYNIEFIKFDFNAQLSFDGRHREFMDYFKGYRAFIKRIRDEFDIYLENCASGGMRMVLGNLEDFDSFWISDNHSIYQQLRIFKDTLIRFPANAIEKWITVKTADGFNGKPFEKLLVSGDALWEHVECVKPEYLRLMAAPGPVGISCDLTAIGKAHLQAIKERIAEFKAQREFWRDAEARILCDMPELTVIQLNDSNFDKIVLMAFSNRAMQNSYTAYPVLKGKYMFNDTVIEESVEIPIRGGCDAVVAELERIKE